MEALKGKSLKSMSFTTACTIPKKDRGYWEKTSNGSIDHPFSSNLDEMRWKLDAFDGGSDNDEDGALDFPNC